jgi:hypothetical protein
MCGYTGNTYLLDYPDWGFPCFFLSCKANARVILAKTGHGPHSSSSVKLVFVLLLLVLLFYGYFMLLYVYFILFYVILYYSMYSFILLYVYFILFYVILYCSMYYFTLLYVYFILFYVILYCSMYYFILFYVTFECICVQTTATGYLPNCSRQIYQYEYTLPRPLNYQIPLFWLRCTVN